MTLRRPTTEQALIFLACLLALVLRLYHLGETPLSDAEANWALQALQISRAGSESAQAFGATLPVSQPAYAVLTAGLFMIFSSSNFLARLLPAIAGTMLVLTPLLFRRQLGRIAALVMIFGLAIDPGLVTVSRQAGGPMMALAFLILAVGLWEKRAIILAGVCAGLALLSGPALIYGLIPLALAWGLTRLALGKSFDSVEVQDAPDGDDEGTTPQPVEPELSAARPITKVDWQHGFLAAVITVFLVGSLFLLYPAGISAWLEMIPAYLRGWVTPTAIPVLRLPAALIFYQPLALIFAIVGVLFGLTQRNLKLVLFLTLWLLVGLVLGLLYPGRQVADLVWLLIPLWGLAVVELRRYIPTRENYHPAAIALAFLVLVLMGLFWFSLATITRTPVGTVQASSRLLILLGIFALIFLSTALVALGWSWKYGRAGLAWGIVAGLTLYLVSFMWGASQLRLNQPQELWGLPPATGQAKLMQSSLNDLSLWQTGFLNNLDIVSTVDLPSLRWMLRNNPEVRFTANVPPGEQPSIIITRQIAETPSLVASYRGQDFVWSVYPAWIGALPPDFLAWFTYRRAPLQLESLILWARGDLFPGSSGQNP